jgi:hypothetical protein
MESIPGNIALIIIQKSGYFKYMRMLSWDLGKDGVKKQEERRSRQK